MTHPTATLQLWVWHLPSLTDALAADLLPRLLPAEQDLYRGMRSPRRQREYLAGHSLVRVALAALVPDWAHHHQLIMNDEQQLQLCGPLAENLDFNLSHSGDWVVCAVGRDCRLGIDIELPVRRRACRALAGEYFAVAESEGLANLADDACEEQFYRLWTLKESCLKARKTGISTTELATELVPVRDGASWYCYALQLPPAPEVFAALTVSVPVTAPLVLSEYRSDVEPSALSRWMVGVSEPLTPRR